MIDLAHLIAATHRELGKVLICGNGGLAAESEHFAAELMGKYGQDVFIPCIALTTNSSLVTALANDMGYNRVFDHQVSVIGSPEDLFIGMTTSASPNILGAYEEARTFMQAVLIGSAKTPNADIVIPGETVWEVQNNIIAFLHQVALEAKCELAGGKPQQPAIR